MPYRRVGTSGLRLPAISLGLWQNFGDDRALATQRAIIRRAFDRGVTHFDLANNYGPPYGSAEANFGRILASDLRPYRDELIISTKAGYDMWPGPYGIGGSRKYLLASLDQSLRRMGLEYVDLFYSHRVDPDTPLEETMGALDAAVRQGKALYVGISSYSARRTREAVAILRALGTPPVIHQPSYSMFNRWIEPELLDVLAEEGMGAIAFSPLAQGLLTDRYLDGVPAEFAGRARGLVLQSGPADAGEPGQRTRTPRDRPPPGADARPAGHRLDAARSARHLRAHRGELGRRSSTTTWRPPRVWRSPRTNSPRSTGSRSRAASTSGRTPATRRGTAGHRVGIGSPLDDLLELRDRESGGRQVLHRVRHAPGARLPELRHGQRADGQVLRRVREPAGGRATGGRGRRDRRRPPAAPAGPSPSGASSRSCSPTWSGSRPLADGRDPEETRELLSRYFDLARDVIGRYGGTVEKFIGDAVMAVWGAPTAHEDDADPGRPGRPRAGRCGADAGPDFQARAGVLTGEAAVTIGATNQGMVAGDLVNTACRLQRCAPPGAVLVGEATQRAASPGDRVRAGRGAGAQGQGRARRRVARRAGRRRRRRPEARRCPRGAVRGPRG